MSMAMDDPTRLLPICLPLLLIFLLRKLLHKCPPHPFPIPPGPTPWPILGNVHQLMGSIPHVKFADLSNIYGPLISVKLGMQLLVVGSSPDVAEEILKENDRVLSARFIRAVVPLEIHDLRRLSTGFSPECGEEWKTRRALFRQELFGGKVMESAVRLREKKAREMADAVRSREGTAVDVGEEAFAAVLNTLSNTLMSQDLIKPGNASAEGVSMKSLTREIMESFGEPNISDLYPILRRLDLQGKRRKAKQVFDKMSEIWLAIAQKRGNGKEGMKETQVHDFLDVLIANNYTKEAICQLFSELFTAGTDTTTATVEWAMAELVRNPESMKRLGEELDREIGPGSAPKENQLPGLPYLQACVKETLRLHPPAPLLLPRCAPEPCMVMNYVIPKDAQVFINVWAIGRDEQPT